MNVIVGDGFYYQADRRLISAVLDTVWYVLPQSAGGVDWFPSPNIIRQSSQYKDYNEYLWYVMGVFRKDGESVLILDKERPGTELSLFSPIYMNNPSRLSEMSRRGIRFVFDPFQTRPQDQNKTPL